MTTRERLTVLMQLTQEELAGIALAGWQTVYGDDEATLDEYIARAVQAAIKLRTAN